jgi:hypothetical protein
LISSLSQENVNGEKGWLLGIFEAVLLKKIHTFVKIEVFFFKIFFFYYFFKINHKQVIIDV